MAADIIHLLPDSVANQIAAGEVVQRPASVVKELVENSLDAGASRIQVFVTDGGKTQIQVVDNGKGMSETDARLSFERHATSKISSARDLYSLSTMGFRGEALASIASVAQVELRTRRPEDELGTQILISGSRVERHEPIACPVGSNFIIKNIFFNVPARRRFLKSDQTELSNIVAEMERVALVHTDIAFTLVNNGSEIYNLQPGSFRQRIIDICGNKTGSELLPVETETSIIKISGYISQPSATHKKGAQQFFFVNGRYMRHPYFASAVMHAYDNLIPPGERPSFFICLTADPASLDVNIHPQKTEIKFENEQAVWQVLSAVVKESLGKYGEVPLIDFNVEDKPNIPIFSSDGKINPINNKKVTSETFTPQGQYNPFNTENPLEKTRCLSNETHQYSLWEGLEMENDDSLPCFQFRQKCIITPVSEGIMVIDQHNAHAAILYQRYLNQLHKNRPSAERLLFPEIVQFTKVECITLEDIISDLELIGFDLTNLGGGSYSVNAVPSGVKSESPSDLLHDIIFAATENVSSIRENVQKTIAMTLSERAAINAGQQLSQKEMTTIIRDLMKLTSPRYTESGKQVFEIIKL